MASCSDRGSDPVSDKSAAVNGDSSSTKCDKDHTFEDGGLVYCNGKTDESTSKETESVCQVQVAGDSEQASIAREDPSTHSASMPKKKIVRPSESSSSQKKKSRHKRRRKAKDRQEKHDGEQKEHDTDDDRTREGYTREVRDHDQRGQDNGSRIHQDYHDDSCGQDHHQGRSSRRESSREQSYQEGSSGQSYQGRSSRWDSSKGESYQERSGRWDSSREQPYQERSSGQERSRGQPYQERSSGQERSRGQPYQERSSGQERSRGRPYQERSSGQERSRGRPYQERSDYSHERSRQNDDDFRHRQKRRPIDWYRRAREYRYELRKSTSTDPILYTYNEIQGDLFSSPKTSSLAHCVSEDLHMGKGIATEFKERFRKVEELKSQGVKPGGVAVIKKGDIYIYYLVTKKRYFHRPTYESLADSLLAMKEHIVDHKVTELSMPVIGCGLDELEWEHVRRIIDDVFHDLPNLNVTVYYL